MSNLAAWAFIVSLGVPLLITFCKQSGLTRTWNKVITVAVCGAVGTVTVWLNGGFNNFKVLNLLGVVAAVIVASQAVYATFWKGTGTEAQLNIKTSFIKTSEAGNTSTLV